MATRYFCDNCGNEEETPIRIIGSKDFYILCKNCWEQVKEKLDYNNLTKEIVDELTLMWQGCQTDEQKETETEDKNENYCRYDGMK